MHPELILILIQTQNLPQTWIQELTELESELRRNGTQRCIRIGIRMVPKIHTFPDQNECIAGHKWIESNTRECSCQVKRSPSSYQNEIIPGSKYIHSGNQSCIISVTFRQHHTSESLGWLFLSVYRPVDIRNESHRFQNWIQANQIEIGMFSYCAAKYNTIPEPGNINCLARIGIRNDPEFESEFKPHCIRFRTRIGQGFDSELSQIRNQNLIRIGIRISSGLEPEFIQNWTQDFIRIHTIM